MVRIGLVLNRSALIVLAVAPFMLTAIPFSLYYRTNDIPALAISFAITGLAAGAMYGCTPQAGEVNHREGILIVALGWALTAGFGALPFYLYGTFPTYTDAYFEAMSGFTTTGASVLADIEAQPAGILFWRSLTHWLGGMGIVVLSLAVSTADKLVPRLRETAKRLYLVYSTISAAEVVLLLLGGMPLFDSLTHMFGTMGTGGFSPKNASVGYYHSAYLEMVIAAFMFIAGANFLLHYNAMAKGDLRGYLKDEEFRFYAGVVTFSTVTVALALVGSTLYPAFLTALRHGLFTVVSIITTTGFVTEDFEKWPAYGHYVLLILMFIGGCTGSTGGAIKCMRIWLLLKISYQQLFQIVHPKAVRTLRYNGRTVPADVIQGVQSMFALYMLTFLVTSTALAALGHDVVTAISAIAATLGNVGPGLGTVGPVENYSHFPLASKWVCSFAMFVGRLEVYSVVVLMVPEFWRR
jgi:trk system potassium uptake protein TrkH